MLDNPLRVTTGGVLLIFATVATALQVFPTPSLKLKVKLPFEENVCCKDPALLVSVILSLAPVSVATTSDHVGAKVEYITLAVGATLSIVTELVSVVPVT